MSRGCSGGGAMLGLSGAGKGARWGPGAVACSWGQCSAWAAGPLPAARLSPSAAAGAGAGAAFPRAGPDPAAARSCRKLLRGRAGSGSRGKLLPCLLRTGPAPGRAPLHMGPPCPRRALGTAASREGLGQGQGPGGQRALGQVRALPWTQRGKHRECGGSRSTACAPFQHPPSGAGSKPAGSRAEAGGWSRRPGRWHAAPRLRSAPRLRWVTSQPVPGALSWPGRAQCSRLCFFQPRSAAAAPHSWLPAGVPLGRGRARGGWQGAEAPRPSPSARCPEAGRPTLQRPWVRPPAGSGSRSPPGRSSVQGRFALAPLLFEAEVPRGRGEPVLLLPTTAATRACVVSEQRLPHQPCCLPPSQEGSGWGRGGSFWLRDPQRRAAGSH